MKFDIEVPYRRLSNKGEFCENRRSDRHTLCMGVNEFTHLGDPDVDGRIILRWIFRKWEGVVGNGWSWLRIGTGGGHFEYGEEPSGSKNAGNFLTSCRTS